MIEPTRKTSLRLLFTTLVCVGLTLLSSRCSLMGGGSEIVRADKFSVDAPKEWRATKNRDADKFYELPSGSRVAVSSSCRRWVRAPLTVMAKQLLIGNRGLKLLRQEPITVAGGEGLLTTAQAREGNRDVFLTLVLVRKQECLFDVVHMGKKEISADEEKSLIAMAKGLHYGTDEAAVGAH